MSLHQAGFATLLNYCVFYTIVYHYIMGKPGTLIKDTLSPENQLPGPGFTKGLKSSTFFFA